jgi:hypothetical protein
MREAVEDSNTFRQCAKEALVIQWLLQLGTIALILLTR